MESNPLHIVRLGKPVTRTGGTPLRLSQTPSQRVSAQIPPKRNVATGGGAVRLSYNQTKLSERAGLRFVEVPIVTPRKVVTQATSSNVGFSFGYGFVSKLAVLALIPMLLIYPLVPAYAADEAVAESTPVEAVPPVAETEALAETSLETSPSETPTPESTSAPEEVTSAQDGSAEASTETSADTPPPTQDDGTPVTDETPTPSDETEGNGNVTPSDTSVEATTTDEIIPVGSGSGEEVSEEHASTTPEGETGSTTPESVVPEEGVASSTEEITDSSETPAEALEAVPETPEQIASRLLQEREGVLRNELRKEIESEYTKGCVSMDSVGYYCLKEGSSNTASALVRSEGVTGVDVSLGAGGYKQITVTRGDKVSELTSSAWDNAFPTTDVSGKSVVWQGNVEGRWQIFFADTSGTGTPLVIQVTHSSESNFNPRVDGKYIVWQGWVDGNWEVYLAEHLDMESALALDVPLPEEHARLGIDRTWRVERVTINNEHDMFPSLSGGLVTWQSFRGGTWNVFAYSMQAKSIVKLSRDGAKSEHPRFSITWDERGEDGRTRMMGYDIATGKVVDITGEARQVSDDTKPYQPEAPISQENQAALPTTTSGTSTSTRTDEGDGASPANGLDI